MDNSGTGGGSTRSEAGRGGDRRTRAARGRFAAVVGLCAVGALLHGCADEMSVDSSAAGRSTQAGGGIVLAPPDGLRSMRIRPEELDLAFTLNGVPQSVERLPGPLWRVVTTVAPGRELEISLAWSTDGIELATFEQRFPGPASDTTLNLGAERYRYTDSDNDSFPNLAEIDAGTNAFDASSFPTALDLIFNTSQSNCLTPEITREAARGADYVNPDTNEVIPILDVDVTAFSSVALAPGDSIDLNYPLSPGVVVLLQLIELTEPGTLTISHESGKPLDSFGEIFERTEEGDLVTLGADDDGGVGLNTSLTVPLARGGYCYLLRHLSRFPIQAGVSIGEGDLTATVRYSFAP